MLMFSVREFPRALRLIAFSTIARADSADDPEWSSLRRRAGVAAGEAGMAAEQAGRVTRCHGGPSFIGSYRRSRRSDPCEMVLVARPAMHGGGRVTRHATRCSALVTPAAQADRAVDHRDAQDRADPDVGVGQHLPARAQVQSCGEVLGALELCQCRWRSWGSSCPAPRSAGRDRRPCTRACRAGFPRRGPKMSPEADHRAAQGSAASPPTGRARGATRRSTASASPRRAATTTPAPAAASRTGR